MNGSKPNARRPWLVVILCTVARPVKIDSPEPPGKSLQALSSQLHENHSRRNTYGAGIPCTKLARWSRMYDALSKANFKLSLDYQPRKTHFFTESGTAGIYKTDESF
ncbi:hypothetical protein EV702DRAFT_1123100 [Suillus placidus]|uniref:Uncharacterized protein n=1 Tax=Suillus placidus TaxID=48579 RepID=A0A9P6ZQ06_9AGAM|nr:hypothetical protein EV702DRAFT_1123100 [Suillus placidus]